MSHFVAVDSLQGFLFIHVITADLPSNALLFCGHGFLISDGGRQKYISHVQIDCWQILSAVASQLIKLMSAQQVGTAYCSSVPLFHWMKIPLVQKLFILKAKAPSSKDPLIRKHTLTLDLLTLTSLFWVGVRLWPKPSLTQHHRPY